MGLDIGDAAGLLDSFLLHLRAERKSPQTVKTYGDGIRLFLRWCEAENANGVGQFELDRPTVELVSRIKTGEGRDAFIRDGSVLIRDYGRLMPAGNCRCLGIGLASAGWLTGLVCRMVRQLN